MIVGFGFVARKGRVIETYQYLELASFSFGRSLRSRRAPGGRTTRARALEALAGDPSLRRLGTYRMQVRCARDDYVLIELHHKLWISVELGLRTQPRFSRLVLGGETRRRTDWGTLVT